MDATTRSELTPHSRSFSKPFLVSMVFAFPESFAITIQTPLTIISPSQLERCWNFWPMFWIGTSLIIMLQVWSIYMNIKNEWKRFRPKLQLGWATLLVHSLITTIDFPFFLWTSVDVCGFVLSSKTDQTIYWFLTSSFALYNILSRSSFYIFKQII